MPTAMFMPLFQSATAIGNAITALGSDNIIEHRRFHYPSDGVESQIYYSTGRCASICRFQAIAEDRESGLDGVNSPSALRFELNLIHETTGDGSQDDPYVYAQDRVLAATSEFFDGLNNDRTLGDLVFGVEIEASQAMDMIDPVTEQELYGHQMTLLVILFRY